MVKTDKDNFKLFPNKILLKNLWVIKINEVRGWLGQAEKTLENKSTWSNPAPLLSILTCPHLPVSTHVYPDRGPEHLLVPLLRSPCRALSHLPSPFLSLGCHQTLGDAWCSPPPLTTQGGSSPVISPPRPECVSQASSNRPLPHPSDK